jgi:hypothetical protein
MDSSSLDSTKQPQNVEEEDGEEILPPELNNADIETLTNASEGLLLIFFFLSSFLHSWHSW